MSILGGRGVPPLPPFGGTAEPEGEQISLARARTAGLWSDRSGPLEQRADALVDRLRFRPFQNFDQRIAARPQQSGEGCPYRFQQGGLVRSIGVADARQLGRGVAEQNVGRAPQLLKKPGDHPGLPDVALNCDQVRIFERGIDRGEVDAHHPAAGADRRSGHLEPAARPAAEVDHALSGSQQPVGLLDLLELVGGARAEPLALGLLVIAVLAVVRGQETVGRTWISALRCPGTAPRR